MATMFPLIPEEPPGNRELVERFAGEKYRATILSAHRAIEATMENNQGGFTTDRVVIPLTKEECAALIVLITKELG